MENIPFFIPGLKIVDSLHRILIKLKLFPFPSSNGIPHPWTDLVQFQYCSILIKRFMVSEGAPVTGGEVIILVHLNGNSDYFSYLVGTSGNLKLVSSSWFGCGTEDLGVPGLNPACCTFTNSKQW